MSNSLLIIGLMLMRLLSCNKIADLHSLFERFSTAENIVCNEFVAFPMGLEESLMEGSFEKVLLSLSKGPSPYFGCFADIITDAIRETIAESCECSYSTLRINQLTQLLFFKSDSETKSFCAARNWTIGAEGNILFSARLTQLPTKQDSKAICESLMKTSLGVAKSIEAII